MKARIYFFGLIILSSILVFFYLQNNYKKDIQTLENESLTSIEQIYTTSFNTYKLFAKREIYSLLEDKKALRLLNSFKKATNEEKKILRAELYRHFIKHYQYLKEYGVRQFHFHTHKGESLLRFHKPHASGDSLMRIRKSIRDANKRLKNTYGFEGGKIYPGFRYLFPIIDKEKHLGSVEYSISFEAIEKLMKDTFKEGNFILHLDKSISHDKVFQWYKSYFSQSVFSDDHYIENSDLSTITANIIKNKTINNINEKLASDKEFKKLFNQKKSFAKTAIIDDYGYIVSFMSINDTSDQHAAYLVSYLKNDNLLKIEDKYLFFYLILFVVTLMMLTLVYVILHQFDKIVQHQDELEAINKQQFNQLKEYVDIIDQHVMVSSTDLKGNITYASDALCKISGYTKDELIGKNHNIFRHPDMSKNLFKGMWKALQANRIFKGEMSNLRKDGSTYWVKMTITPMINEKQETIGYTAIRQDITDKKVIEEISITDGLTNIYNRRHFDTIFPKIVNRAKRHNALVSFIILDVDFFKQYNDTYGHKMGDEVLVEVAEAIQKTLKRADDYCFRLGGEEFGVIFDIEDVQHAVKFANTIRKNISNLQIEHRTSGIESYITASLGLVCKKANQIKTIEDLYQEADSYLYKAKKAGRNKVISNFD